MKTHHDGQHIQFVSGAASTGADRLIIEWCKVYPFHCHEVPADWDQYGKKAGYIRNEWMSQIGTHLLAYYDGVSRGTRHMLAIAKRMNIPTEVVKVII